MTRNVIAALVAVAALSTPVFAATEYYVAQKAGAKGCEVTTTKPDGKTMMMVGKDMYKTDADAKKAMAAAAECK